MSLSGRCDIEWRLCSLTVVSSLIFVALAKINGSALQVLVSGVYKDIDGVVMAVCEYKTDCSSGYSANGCRQRANQWSSLSRGQLLYICKDVVRDLVLFALLLQMPLVVAAADSGRYNRCANSLTLFRTFPCYTGVRKQSTLQVDLHRLPFWLTSPTCHCSAPGNYSLMSYTEV